MDMIKITINGVECVGEKGSTILDLARAGGVEIPTLCHHESVKWAIWSALRDSNPGPTD